MKKIMLFVIFSLFCAFNTAYAGDKKVNLKTNTFGFPFGVSFELEYKLTNHFSVSPTFFKELSTFNYGTTSEQSSGLGLGINWYFEEALQQGQYISSSIMRVNTDYKENLTEVYTGTDKGFLLCMSYGKLWLWDAFNLTASLMYCNMSSQDYVLTAPSGSSMNRHASSSDVVFPLFSAGYAW